MPHDTVRLDSFRRLEFPDCRNGLPVVCSRYRTAVGSRLSKQPLELPDMLSARARQDPRRQIGAGFSRESAPGRTSTAPARQREWPPYRPATVPPAPVRLSSPSGPRSASPGLRETATRGWPDSRSGGGPRGCRRTDTVRFPPPGPFDRSLANRRDRPFLQRV